MEQSRNQMGLFKPEVDLILKGQLTGAEMGRSQEQEKQLRGSLHRLTSDCKLNNRKRALKAHDSSDVALGVLAKMSKDEEQTKQHRRREVWQVSDRRRICSDDKPQGIRAAITLCSEQRELAEERPDSRTSGSTSRSTECNCPRASSTRSVD